MAYAALACALSVVGYWLLFTTFMVYDDEGYVLWSLRSYSNGGKLYEEVFSQYGPFLYVYYRALHLLGLPFDNVAGRLVTLAYWLATAFLAAGLTWRLARSQVAAASAAALTFVALAAMVREPIHPGGLITIIAMLGVAATVVGIVRENPRLFAAAAAATCALLALVKINVGVFFGISAAAWMLASTRPSRNTGWILAIGCLGTPLLLMRALWPAPWVTQFALVFACGTLALVPSLQAAAIPEHGRRTWGPFVAIGALIAALTVAIVALHGTSLAALWNGMVVAPLRHPGVYFFAVSWLPGSSVLAILLLLAAIGVQSRPLTPQITTILAAVRVAAALWFATGAYSAQDENLTRFALSYGPALAWLMALPLSGAATSAENRARTWLAWAYLWQTLHAYPVAGSQIAWGTFVWPTLAVLGLVEASRVLAGRWRWLPHAALAVIATAAALATWRIGAAGRGYFLTSEPLGLPGAASLRPPADIRRQLRVVHENLQAHADVVYSLPGMFSQNIWSGLPTPTDANATHWFSLLSPTEQQGIIARLESAPRAAVVVHRFLVDFLARDGFPVRGPLSEYLARSFEPTFSVGFYELHVRRARRIAALSTARFVSPGHLEATLAIPHGHRVASARIERSADSAPMLALSPRPESPWIVQPVEPDGTPSAPPQPQTAAFELSGRVTVSFEIPERITLSLSARPISGPPVDYCLVFLDATGAEIAAAYLLK